MSATVYGWRHLVKATEENAGLAESRPNGSLPPGGRLKVTCRLTACTSRLAPGPTLGTGNEYGRTFLLYTIKRYLPNPRGPMG